MTPNITLDEDRRAVLYPREIKSGKAFYAQFRSEKTELTGNQHYLRERMKTGNQLLATTRATQRHAELTKHQNNDMVIKSLSVEDEIRAFMVEYETRLKVNLTTMILVMRQSITKFTFFFINIRNGIKIMVSDNECRTKEQTMSPWKVIITLAFFTLCASFNQQAATAGEKGTMDFVQSILIANQMAIQQGDHKMIAIVGNGTITFSNSDGGPFMEGSSATLSVIAYIKQTENGMNLESPMSVSDPSGDKLFMVMRRSTGTFDSGGGGQGRAELGGGTGKFAGLTGSCPYEVNFLDGGNVVVRATGCSWEKP